MQIECGSFSFQIDAKNRLRLPAKRRDSYGEEFYLSMDLRGSILVRTEEDIAELYAKLRQASMSDWETNDVISEFSAQTFSVKQDEQGRFMLPSVLKDYADIKKDVLIIGTPRGWTIWAKEVYETRHNPSEKHLMFEQRIAPRLKQFGV